MPDFLFDKRDRLLLLIVNDVLTGDKSRKDARKLVYPRLHPHGIKEMAESKGLRIAYAVIHLLEFLEAASLDDRLNALRALRDEVLSATGGSLPTNTARVLLSIMKDLVRAHGNEQRQLRLAHDFRKAAAGNPRITRSLLRRYNLLEMPEAWNQLAFDDHVHDIHTKGRKSPCHLIMDAWIKGIRRLRVIYYNYVEPRFVTELLLAAEIMGITLRIGIEFWVRMRDRYAQVIWVPRGFSDTQSFLWFLAEEPVAAFFSQAKEVSGYQQRYVTAVVREFNSRHRFDMEKTYGFEMPMIDSSEFNAFVGTGQASVVHLGEFIHKKAMVAMHERLEELRALYEAGNPGERSEIESIVRKMNALDSEEIMNAYLVPAANPDILNPGVPADGPEVPELLRLSPPELLERLNRLHPGYRVTLNLSGLTVEDVLEILYDAQGAVTRLEIFNLKDYAEGKTEHLCEINELQQALNEGSAVHLKRMIRRMVTRLQERGDNPERVEKLLDILHDIPTLTDAYKGAPLKSRIGSDSTGRAPRVHGMGLAILETLPGRARREVAHPSGPPREMIPVRITAFRRTTHIPFGQGNGTARSLFALFGKVPCLSSLVEERHEDWIVDERSIRLERPGNVLTLGGVQSEVNNGLSLSPAEDAPGKSAGSWSYLKSGWKNALKVLLGFAPAFITFYCSRDWWLLAYFGAFIWFAITGLRNVLQSVLGGGGIRRSPLLRWKDYVSWERITDSLLFTGFSVPLLDLVVKTILLDKGLGINISTSPVVLYAAMALANGLYISCHNAFRGFPRGVTAGNFFRTVLSIPIAVVFNSAAGLLLAWSGAAGIDAILQNWAAIISKLASDLVAGIIEGTSDRYQNIRMRLKDYREKLMQVFDAYAQLELLFPEDSALTLLHSRETRRSEIARRGEGRDLLRIITINALDLLYFWMYQPRARTALKAVWRGLPPEERRIMAVSQSVLEDYKETSQMFVDGLLGRNFSHALSFYLTRSQEYLEIFESWKQKRL